MTNPFQKAAAQLFRPLNLNESDRHKEETLKLFGINGQHVCVLRDRVRWFLQTIRGTKRQCRLGRIASQWCEDFQVELGLSILCRFIGATRGCKMGSQMMTNDACLIFLLTLIQFRGQIDGKHFVDLFSSWRQQTVNEVLAIGKEADETLTERSVREKLDILITEVNRDVDAPQKVKTRKVRKDKGCKRLRVEPSMEALPQPNLQIIEE